MVRGVDGVISHVVELDAYEAGVLVVEVRPEGQLVGDVRRHPHRGRDDADRDAVLGVGGRRHEVRLEGVRRAAGETRRRDGVGNGAVRNLHHPGRDAAFEVPVRDVQVLGLPSFCCCCCCCCYCSSFGDEVFGG